LARYGCDNAVLAVKAAKITHERVPCPKKCHGFRKFLSIIALWESADGTLWH
jgi:hypothetical protein